MIPVPKYHTTISKPFAIAKLAISTIWHSRVVIWLLAIVTGINIWLPFMLKGDGTPVGQIRLMITYPLAISFIVMTLGTLWLSAGLISLEISGKEIQSIAVKPIRAIDIWLGKWLALVAINTMLVVVTALCLLLSVTIASNRYKENRIAMTSIQQQILTGRHAVQVDAIPNLLEKSERLRQRLIRQRVIPETTSVTKMCGELKTARSMVAPGKTLSWSLPLSKYERQLANNHKLSLRYMFSCNAMERQPVSGTWSIKSAESPPLKIEVNNITDGIHNISLPETFRINSDTLTISFEYTPAPPVLHSSESDGGSTQPPEPSTSPTIYFAPDAPVELLIHASSFTMNLIRSMIAIICFLACISAIGLIMSTLFSFPVAAFSATAIIFAVTLASGFSEEPVDHHHGPEQAPAKIIQLTEPSILFVKHATQNIVTNIPITKLADGMIFSWKQTGECIALLLLLIPAVLALLSSLLLSQKELAI